jgi:dihydroorotate dehydrogenase electron transfer subunit
MNIPEIVEIKRIIKETNTVKTLVFDWKVDDEKPGQFLMVWNFHDEKPMAFSLIDPVNGEIGISIKKVGKFTNSVHSLNVGDKLGLRGPYGCGFELAGSRILAVGGGVGMAPIAALVEDARESNVEVDVISAAVTADELLFIDRLENVGANVAACTDDGSYGFKGFATDISEKFFKKDDYDLVVTCGPELMMKGIYKLTEEYEIPAQFLLERWMKCGMGLCGQCCVDDVGWRVCVEGPVFSTDEIRLISEFGKYRRDASGMKHHL